MDSDATGTEPDKPAAMVEHEIGGNALTVCENGSCLRDMVIDLIDSAQKSLKLYYYIFGSDESGRLVMAHLIRAARRGVDVQLMIDAFGSLETPASFLASLQKAGGRIGTFGSRWSTRYLIRNHQKMAIADERRAIIGSFNVADAYFGIPEDDCWHDMGLRIDGPEAEKLVRWYDLLWKWVTASRQSLRRLRAMVLAWHDASDNFRWLVGGPTYRLSPWARTVRMDLEKAKKVDMVAAYFSPGNSTLARLKRVARRGKVRLVLASKSDNTSTVAASRLLYGPLLRAGVTVYEYQPCRLHMKLVVIDDLTYIGSANFDMRSLFINVELMLRIKDAAFADKMRAFIDDRAADSELITCEVHKARKTPFRLLKGWISYFLVGVLDYKVTRRLNF